MQGRAESGPQLWDTAALVGHLVPAGSVYALLAEFREVLFPDGMFSDLFPSGRGRPSVPGAVIASVLVLQTLQDLSDAEAVQAVRCDLRWKVACGLPIDHGGFLRVEGSGVGALDAQDVGVWLMAVCRAMARKEWPPRRSGRPGR